MIVSIDSFASIETMIGIMRRAITAVQTIPPVKGARLTC